MNDLVRLRKAVPLSAENENDADAIILALDGLSKVCPTSDLSHCKEDSVSYIINMEPEAIRDALCNRVGCAATLISDVLTVEGKDRSQRAIAVVNDINSMSETCARYVRHHPEALSFSRDRFGVVASKSTILTTSADTAEWLYENLSCINVVRSLDDYVRWNLGGSAAGMDSIEAKPRRVSFYKEDARTGEARYIRIGDMEEIADTLSVKVNGRIGHNVLAKMLAHVVGHEHSDGIFTQEDVSGCHVFDDIVVRKSGSNARVSLDDRFNKDAESNPIPDGHFAISVSESGNVSPLAKTLLSCLEDIGAMSYEEAISANHDCNANVSKPRKSADPHI